MPRLYGFWLCAVEYAKCNQVEVFELSQQQRDDLWSSLTDDEKHAYKLKAKEYNNKYGTEVNWRVYEEVVVVRHWGEDCKDNASKCCTVAVPAPSVEQEEEWDVAEASASASLWNGLIDDEDFPDTVQEAAAIPRQWNSVIDDDEELTSEFLAAPLAQQNAEEEEEEEEEEVRLIAAGAEEDDWTFNDDDIEEETVYQRGEDYSLEDYFETIEINHPGYAHHRKQLPRAVFRK